MGGTKTVPPPSKLYVEARSEAYKRFGEIGKRDPDIVEVGVAGPWVPKKGYQPGEDCLTDDKICGVTYGPCIHVGIITNRDSYTQNFKPIEMDREEIQKTARELEKQFGVTVIVSSMTTMELNSRVPLSLTAAEEHMFADKICDFELVLCK